MKGRLFVPLASEVSKAGVTAVAVRSPIVEKGAISRGIGQRRAKTTSEEPSVRVLVVDDDPDIRETLREVIEMEGFEVTTAANGRVAMEALRAGLRPSLIVLDLMMPTMSGWDVLAAIRGDRALTEIPVAVISAAGGRTPPPGATHFLKKPIDLDDLLDVVRDPRPYALRIRGRAIDPVAPGLTSAS